jgi:hypothetical protein
MLLAFAFIRTAFLTQQASIEPRYVIVCFPAFLAIAAQAWTISRPSLASTTVQSRWASGHATAN